MEPFRIIAYVGCRSDEGLSAPVIRRLKESDWCEVKTVKLEPQNFIHSYEIAEYHCKAAGHIGNSKPFKPDLVLITGDRAEMCAAAAAAFHNNVKIAHLYAGVVNDPVTTYDDIDRHCITLWSDIQFCENVTCGCVTELIKYNAFLKPNAHVVGITHLDDIEIDESKVPIDSGSQYPDGSGIEIEWITPYDLILYNTPTKGNNEQDVYQIAAICNNSENYKVLVCGNPDGDKELEIISWCDEFFTDLPRAQFLGLLKNCRRFITNSSSATYEAPYFLKPEQIVKIGDRNRNRPEVKCVPGGSDKIVEILKRYAEKSI